MSEQVIAGEGTIRYRRVLVTPEYASQLLSYNSHNRPLRPKGVEKYVHDMKAGRWQENGDAIRVADDGVLLDGQHRLLALTEAGVSLWMLVVTGLPPEAQETVDGGMRRGFPDALRLRGTPYWEGVATVTRRVHMWNLGVYKHQAERRMAVSNYELFDTLFDNPDIFDSAKRVYSEKKKRDIKIYPSTLGVLHWVFTRLDKDDATYFFDKLFSGADLSEVDPIHVLRRNLIAAQARQLDRDLETALVIKAWNAYREGRSVTLLAWKMGGRAAEPFPKPI